MSELQVPKCSCYVQGEVNAVFTRPCLCPNRATESLIAAAAGELVPLEGARERRGLLIGPAFSPTFVSQPGGALPSTCLYAPCYDPFSNSVFAAPGHAIVRLTADNHVRLIAGSVQDSGQNGGPGIGARFMIPISTTSDGQGGLYVVDHNQVWKLQLPESWRAVSVNTSEPTRTSSNKGCPSNTGRRAASGVACTDGGGGGGSGDGVAAAAAAATGGCSSTGTHLQGSGEGLSESTVPGPGRGQGVQEDEVQVRPLDCGPVLTREATAVAYDPSTQTLMLSSDTAIFRRSMVEGPPLCVSSSCSAASTASRLQPQQPPQQQQQQFTAPGAIAQPDAPPAGVPGPLPAAPAETTAEAAAAAATGGGTRAQKTPPTHPTASSTPQATLELLAGRQDVFGHADGRGPDAHFRCILGLVVDGYGCAYVADYNELANSTTLRRVAPDGTVTTPVSHLEGIWDHPAVLPNGYLTLCSRGGSQLMVLDLGLTPNACHAAAVSTLQPGPPPHSLPFDLGALLDRQPDGTADVTVEVGGQAFAAHRGVLAARSPYFRQRLDPGAGFADGGAQRLSLPDADAGAFGVVLRYMYTDSVGAIPEGLLQPVGELADRLLLPGLCEEVGQQLIAGVSEDNVVSLMLWADQRSGSFSALLAGLKEWFVEHKDAVAGRDLTSIRRLMAESPDLAVQLYHNPRQGHGAGHKRPRVGNASAGG